MGLYLGLELARQGRRPVPLYNAVPAPGVGGPAGSLTSAPVAVDLGGIADALSASAGTLAELHLPAEAPPAFLLDSRRRRGDNPAALMPGGFDNCSITLPSDFPSASFLRAAGIRRVVLIAPGDAREPQPDLAHTLRRWQDAGIGIEMLRPGADPAPRPIDVPKPRWYRHAWHALLVKLGLRPHLLGGFGGSCRSRRHRRGSRARATGKLPNGATALRGRCRFSDLVSTGAVR